MESTSKHDGSIPATGPQIMTDAIDRAGSGVQSAIDDLSGAARPAVQRITDDAHRAVNRMASAADRASEALQAQGKQFERARQRLGLGARSMVSEHPLTALGIAVAAGFLLSRFVRTR